MRNVFDTEKMEVEINLCVHRLLDFKQHLSEILDRYRVNSPEEIKEKIRLKQINSHPAYEDYLDAISYKLETENLLSRLGVAQK